MKQDTNTLLSVFENELAQRLEKLWRIFSWCSSILITIAGGIILATRGIEKITIYLSDRIIISVIIFTIGIYAVLWIAENLHLEKALRDKIQNLLKKEYQDDYLGKKRPDNAVMGYIPVIIILTCIALAATWLDYICK